MFILLFVVIIDKKHVNFDIVCYYNNKKESAIIYNKVYALTARFWYKNKKGPQYETTDLVISEL